ncbi:MAG TPA: exonuclease SbcCD subunit D [Thermodesulfobacteriota bacterium]|nr:exonuclease SbcCD subunit D [Thermodesulfobacteriota bacterium]
MRNALKFIHLSDIHIGIETHGRLNPATGWNTRFEDVLRSLDFVVDAAIRESVDLVLIAGDVFHRENPHPTEETEFAKRIVRLVSEIEAKVVIVLGNHDYPAILGKTSAVEIFPAINLDGVYVARKPDILFVPIKEGRLQVACLPWAGRSTLLAKEEYKSLSPEALQVEIEKRLINIIRDFVNRLDQSLPTVFLGHVAVRDAQLSGTEITTLLISEPSIPRTELANPVFSYAALGHIHKFQNLNENSTPPVVYSGSIERIDFTEEKEKKGFVLGEIFKDENGWRCDFKFVETPARRFLTVEVKGKVENMDEAKVLEHLPREDIKDAVIRVRCVVSRPEDRINEKMIREALSEAYSVKIEKIFEKPERVIRQSELSRTTDVMDALDRYIRSKPELKNISEDMKKYAKELIRESEEA